MSEIPHHILATIPELLARNEGISEERIVQMEETLSNDGAIFLPKTRSIEIPTLSEEVLINMVNILGISKSRSEPFQRQLLTARSFLFGKAMRLGPKTNIDVTKKESRREWADKHRNEADRPAFEYIHRNNQLRRNTLSHVITNLGNLNFFIAEPKQAENDQICLYLQSTHASLDAAMVDYDTKSLEEKIVIVQQVEDNVNGILHMLPGWSTTEMVLVT